MILTRGNDTLNLDQAIQPTWVFGLDGDDSALDSHLADTLFGGGGNDLPTSYPSGPVDVSLYCGTGQDTINGIIYGGFVDGGFGNDRIDLGFAGDGATAIQGGEGNDLVRLSNE